MLDKPSYLNEVHTWEQTNNFGDTLNKEDCFLKSGGSERVIVGPRLNMWGNCTQRVVIDGSLAKWKDIEIKFYKDLFLFPVLFNIFIND